MINIRLVLVCLFYFLGCYLWYEHSPFPDLHKWTYKMQAVYYILPLQVLFLFSFFGIMHGWPYAFHCCRHGCFCFLFFA